MELSAGDRDERNMPIQSDNLEQFGFSYMFPRLGTLWSKAQALSVVCKFGEPIQVKSRVPATPPVVG